MRRTLTALTLPLLLALAAATAAGAAKPAPASAQLLREAEQRTGLKPRAPIRLAVVAPWKVRAKVIALDDRDYPRAAQAYDEQLYRALGLLGPGQTLRGPLLRAEVAGANGVYDPDSRTVYVARGKTQTAAAVEGFVRALIDQAFTTRKALAVGQAGRDAALAARASTAGVADLFARVLPNPVAKPKAEAKAKPTRKTQASSRIATFLALEQGFPQGSGLRWASVLYNVGGREVALDALKRLPATTAQVFHMDAYLERQPALPVELPAGPDGYALVRDDTFGELDVRALLAVFGVPKLDAVAEGWGAGLSALYRGPAGDAFALRLDWQTEADAQEWADALPAYVTAAFGAGDPTPCDAGTCWSAGGRQVAFSHQGASTALVLAPTLEDASALASSLTPAS